jgi:hypothetical protein
VNRAESERKIKVKALDVPRSSMKQDIFSRVIIPSRGFFDFVPTKLGNECKGSKSSNKTTAGRQNYQKPLKKTKHQKQFSTKFSNGSSYKPYHLS